ncbi:MAG: response regulator transcription factor [Anaerolineales bacterium]
MQAVLFCPHADEANVLQIILEQAGILVRSVRNLDQAIESWPNDPADLILIVLSEESSKSLTQLKLFRAHAVVPILLISDVLSDDMHVNYLEAGADLVVFRPYSVRALVAQIRAILRRGSGVPSFSLPSLTQREVELNPADRTVKVGNGPSTRLTQLEFRLLYTLMTHIGQIIPTDQIVEHVWGYTGEGNRDLVRGLVQRVRSKIEDDPRQPKYIITEVGIGYYFSR